MDLMIFNGYTDIHIFDFLQIRKARFFSLPAQGDPTVEGLVATGCPERDDMTSQ